MVMKRLRNFSSTNKRTKSFPQVPLLLLLILGLATSIYGENAASQEATVAPLDQAAKLVSEGAKLEIKEQVAVDPKDQLQVAESQPKVQESSATQSASEPAATEKYAPPVDTKQSVEQAPLVFEQQHEEVGAVNEEPVPVVSSEPEQQFASQPVDNNSQQQQANPETEPARARVESNDIVQSNDQFGRKTSSAFQATSSSEQTDSQSKSIKGRSLKRAFGGHLGVFGRKRSQQQQQQGDEAPEAKSASQQSKSTNHHYYYQTSSTSATRAPSRDTTVRLKSADYPDYREILIQPDQGELQRQQQQQPATEEQRVEQQQPQTSEYLTEAPQTSAQQQEQQQEVQEQEQPPPNTPYIRLSNIATINSTSSASNNASGSADVKLMRIYVIDLDQKLVVGNQQPGYSDAKESSTLLPESEKQVEQQQIADQKALEQPVQQTVVETQTTAQPVVQQEQQQQQPYVPEGYVLVDRDTLQANLSQVLAQMGHHRQQQNYSTSTAGEHILVPAYTPTQPLYSDVQPEQAPEAYGLSASLRGGSGNSVYNSTGATQPHDGQIAAIYPQPVQQVPQYIAPQYKHPDNEYSEAQQQVRYNHSNNYTRVAAVQAPAPRLQDKHHATNSTHLYQQAAELYQQTGTPVEPLAGYQSVEPAQAHHYNNEPASTATYKVTSGWKPVDYLAPTYSQTQQQQQSREQLSSISPAQYTNKINGYNRDHDVVSAVKMQQGAQNNGYEAPGQHFSSSPSTSSASSLHSYDGQHAPVNYHRSKQAKHYVNTAPVESGADYQESGQQPSSVYQQSGDTGPQQASQQVQAHQSSAYQYNGTRAELLEQTANEFAKPATGYAQLDSQYGANALSAYGTPRQPEQSAEAPRIPRPQSAGYKHRPQAYLSVSGPPVADGVYESPEADALERPAQRAPRVRVKSRNPQSRRPNKSKQHASYAQQADSVQQSDYYGDQLEADYMSAPANYPHYQRRPQHQYRPAPNGAAKGLLSWETISSVASGAAKRLPSLSSILMPFSNANPAMKPLNYAPAPGYQSSSYPKSAHYDRDVANFHRPYPLRHMNPISASSYSDSPTHHHHHHHESTGESLAQPDYHHDLASSSSSAGGESTEEAAEEPAEPSVSKAANSTEPSDEKHESEVNEDAKFKTRRPQKSPLKRPAKAKGGAPEEVRAEGKPQLDSSHAAVLSSIEQELGELGAPAGKTKPRRGRKKPLDLVEPSIESGDAPRGVPVSLDSLPTDQQQLLMMSGEKKLPVDVADSAPLFPQPQQLPDRGPPGLHQMRPPASMQIGPYKITPQTQFVQSIIEPSRQMLGQYFKQYIGQLGQLGRR